MEEQTPPVPGLGTVACHAQAALLGVLSAAKEVVRTGSPPARLLIHRSVTASLAVSVSHALSEAAGRYIRCWPSVIERCETVAAMGAGGATLFACANGIHRMGASWQLQYYALPFFILPAAGYVGHVARDSLVLWRSARPRTTEAMLCAVAGALPLPWLPHSLRALLSAPLLLPPICAAWLSEAAPPEGLGAVGGVAWSAELDGGAAATWLAEPLACRAGADLAAATSLFGRGAASLLLRALSPAPFEADPLSQLRAARALCHARPSPPGLGEAEADDDASMGEADSVGEHTYK